MYFKYSKNDNSPIVCNVPHGGILIPEEFKKDFVIEDKALEDEVLYMADNYTDSLYAELLYVSSFIKSTISRVVVDIERFEKEADEPMSKVGMSAFYIKTSTGKVLRIISEENIEKLRAIYRDYHTVFTDLVKSSLLKYDKAIVVDCHSFPSVPRQYEPQQEINRPDICIGVDEYHTPKELVEIVKNNFEELGFSVKINNPFSGSIVPMEFYQKDKRVISIMIEVNRKLYMNEELIKKTKNFNAVGKSISRCIIKSLNQYVK